MRETSTQKVKWAQILGYYLAACLLSAPFRLTRFAPAWYEQWSTSGQFTFIKGLFEGVGPLLVGLAAISLSLSNSQRRINMFGISTAGSLAFLSAPILACMLVGLPTGSYNEHTNGAITGALLIVYCISEELFWRGYLQNALKSVSPLLAYLLIGILWYGWHLTFLMPTTLTAQFTHLSLTILGSFLIGKLAEDTRSVLVAASAHSVFNVFYALPITLPLKLVIMVITVGIWIVVRIGWYRKPVTKQI